MPPAIATPTGDSGSAAPRQLAVELRAHNISVDFGGVHALRGVDFTVAEQDVLGLIGPNGAGKTTLLNVLTGFQRPTGGRVMLNEEDGTKWSPQKWVKKGVVRTFQGARVFGRMSVQENIEVGAVSQGVSVHEARDRAGRLIEDYGLAGFADRPASTLPAGLRRRLGIARALASEPRMLLLDEPAAGLNEVERSDLVRLIAEVGESTGCGIVVIEHSMPVIMKLCRRLHVLDDGRTLMEGTPAEVRLDPGVRAAYLGA